MTASGQVATARSPIHAPTPAPLALSLVKPAKTRDARIDLLRIAAILAVVTIHTVSPLTAAAVVPRYSTAWWLGALWNVVSLWCVPVFVQISGALLLTPNREAHSVSDFYRRRLRRIAIPLVFWSALYLLLRPTLFRENLSVAGALHDLALGRPFLQVYYLFVIAGLYLVTPVLRLVINRIGRHRLGTLAFALLLFNVVDYTVQAFGGVGGTDALTEWLPFVGYFVAGAWIASISASEAFAKHRHRLPWLFVGGAALTLLLTAAMCHHFGWTAAGRYFLGYQSPTVVLMSLAVFAWISTRPAGARLVGVRAPAQQRVTRHWVNRLGESTYGVFLVHPLLLVPLFLYVGRPTSVLGVALLVPFIVVAICALSAAATLMLCRVPFVRRLVS